MIEDEVHKVEDTEGPTSPPKAQMDDDDHVAVRGYN